MRIVFKTTSENLIPETIFNGTNQEFAREMFRIINSYAYKKFNIEWGEDYIMLKKNEEIIYLHIYNYVGKKNDGKRPPKDESNRFLF